MTKINLKVSGASATATLDGILTSGMIGIPVSIEYNQEWSGLLKTCVFRVGSFQRDRKNITNEATVPWEVMRHYGKVLEIGVEGRNDAGDIVIPTIWAKVGTIKQGANATVPGAPDPDQEEEPSGNAIIDDSVIVSNRVWSSKNTVDKLCPSFTESGEWATCNPIESSYLNIETKFRPIIPEGVDPSIEEPEDIGYWSDGTLYHGSKNLVDLKAVENVRALSWTNASGNTISAYKGFSFSLPAGTYTVRGEFAIAGGQYVGMVINSADGAFKSSASLIWGSVKPAATVTIDDGDIIYIYDGISGGTIAKAQTLFKDKVNIMVEAGSTSSPYVPYNGNEFSVNFGQNVYGGTYNWTTGLLSIDVVGKTMDGSSDENWQLGTAENGNKNFWRYINDRDGSVYVDKCSHLKNGTGAYYGTYTSFYPSGVTLIIYIDGYTTEDEYRDFLDEYTPTFVYGLAAPIKVQLTPQEFRAISGTNVCHSNMGETTVKGSESINYVIERLTNAILALGGTV